MGVSIKNDKEIGIMRRSGKILSETLTFVQSKAKAGVTTAYLDKLAEEFILDAGAIPSFKGYQGFPGTLCIAVNDEVVHTIPSSEKVLQNGDILTIDGGVYLDGYHTDSATTFGIGEIDPDTESFIETVREILYGAIRLVKPGVKTGDIGYFIEKETKKAGFHVIKELIGHGIGQSIHEDPQVPNFGKPGKGVALKPGMTFCIEPIIGYSTRLIDTLDDDWCIVTRDGGLSCQQEHTVLVTQNGFEVITLRSGENI